MIYAFLLMASIGLTVVLIDVKHGPGPWFVRRWLRPVLSWAIGLENATNLLTCGVCFSVWAGLGVGAVYGLAVGDWFPAATLPPSAACGFWFVLRLTAARGL